MILLKSNQLNKIVVTLTQNTTVCDPEYLFQFVHIFSKQEVKFILPDVSPHPTRYNQFEFVEGQGVGQIPFPYEGQYNYYVYAQPLGSSNTNPLLATELVEQGISVFIVQSADTTNEYYVEFISNDEFDSNVIFAPDEINPPSPTPTGSGTPTPTPTNTGTPTQTPTQTNTQTPTPSVTAGLTPTATESPTPTPTPTNTSTPSQTPSNTGTPTQTPTQTNTQTPTNTVTPTTTQTQTPTNTGTPTQTPTNTGTPTQTASPTMTPTNTTTQTQTPTNTPSNTPNAVCPEEFVVTNSSSAIFDDGTYSRQYLASGQTFQYGYAIQITNSSGYIVLGTAPDGRNYPIFQYPNGGDINTVYYAISAGGNNLGWYSMEQSVNILSSGATWIGLSTNLFTTTESIEFNSVYYPRSGQNLAGYITYPTICPTPTPTASVSATPTQTPTNTPTQTQTNTQTQTPSQTATQTQTPSQTQTQTPSNTASQTPTPTPTNTQTPTNTITPTNTSSPTPTNTATPTFTPTPSVTPVFDPSQISELRTWYDADDATTITLRSGTDFIEKWDDKSGNGYHLTQSTAANQPLFTGGTSLASWSANTYIYLDGTDFLARTTGTSFSDTGFTYFYVGRIVNSELDGLLLNYTDQSPPVNAGKYRSYQSGTGVNRSLTLGADNNRLTFDWTTPSTIGGKNTYQYGWVSGTTAGAFSGAVNDIIATTTGSAGTIPNDVNDISVGANNDGAAPVIGYIAEIIVYGKVLTTAEKNNVETYLKNKWGYNTW